MWANNKQYNSVSLSLTSILDPLHDLQRTRRTYVVLKVVEVFKRRLCVILFAMNL